MTVSVCIIAYNEEKTLTSLFSDIKNQDYPHNKMEVILVNSMSSDRTRVLMEKFAEEENGFLRVKVFDNPKKKQAAGWNIAIKNSLTMNKNGVSKRYAFFVSMYYASRILDVHQERCSIFLGSLVRVQDLLFLLI